ncbi:MAG: heme o synthase [Phycisphaerales bacterium]
MSTLTAGAEVQGSSPAIPQDGAVTARAGAPALADVAGTLVESGAAPAIALAPPPFTCAEPVDPADRSLVSAIVELGKPRITRLVAITALGGLALSLVGRGAPAAPVPWLHLAVAATACALGTALCSGGANGFNQVMESSLDARMHRTRRRPIPSGRVSPALASLASSLMLAIGAAILWAFCGQASASAAILTAATYVLLYTPLKRVTVLNTWVGTIPGALPPLIGWCAGAYAFARGSESAGWAALAEPGGWSLVTLMVVWQIPHFLALAWLHREDYARGGMRMLPVIDPTGRATMLQIVIWSALLVPASLSPWLVMPDRVGLLYAGVAAVTGVGYFVEAARLTGDRTPARARRVFLASVIHLPVLMLALAVSAWLA